MLSYILAFVSLVVLDFIYALYCRKVADGSSIKASFYASTIFVVNSYVIISYVKDPTMIIPSVLGAFVGTWAAVEWDKKHGKQSL